MAEQASNTRRASLREIMLLAWDLYRSDPRRGFADALRGAWKWTKGLGARVAALPRWAKGSHPRAIAFGTMVHSPIRRSLGGEPYANTDARWAGRTTTALGL